MALIPSNTSSASKLYLLDSASGIPGSHPHISFLTVALLYAKSATRNSHHSCAHLFLPLLQTPPLYTSNHLLILNSLNSPLQIQCYAGFVLVSIPISILLSITPILTITIKLITLETVMCLYKMKMNNLKKKKKEIRYQI